MDEQFFQEYEALMGEVETLLCVFFDRGFTHEDWPEIRRFNEVEKDGLTYACFEFRGEFKTEDNGTPSLLTSVLPVMRGRVTEGVWRMQEGAGVLLTIEMQLRVYKCIASWNAFVPNNLRNVWVTRYPMQEGDVCWVGTGLAEGERRSTHLREMPNFKAVPRL